MLGRIFGMLLGLALGAAGYAILNPGGLEGRIPPIPLGPFAPQGHVLAYAAMGLGLVIFIAALLPKGPGGPGGGKRSKGEQPIVVDFSAPAPAPAPTSSHDSPHAAHPPAVPPPAPPTPPQGHAPPDAVGAFAEARRALHAETRAEHWPQAAELVRRLSSLAATDREHMLAAQDRGDFARGQGHFEDAAEAYDDALTYARKLGDRAALADALINVGDVAYDEQRLEAAVHAYEECLALRRDLAAEDPTNLSAKRRLSLVLERLADAREDRGHRMRALDLYKESLGVAQHLAAANAARYGKDLEFTRRRVAELEAKISAI
ncbi:MAG TPA: tetratricopeptide repeat protein [Phenylobacterium sp.]|nr:tetratricopeptide repeat protein [Phenylobacterium sp.]